MRGSATSIRILMVGLVITSLIFMPGCSLFVPRQQAVTIRCADPTADVFVDGEKVGKGTLSMTLDRTKSHTVTAKADRRAGSVGHHWRVLLPGAVPRRPGAGILGIGSGCGDSVFAIGF